MATSEPRARRWTRAEYDRLIDLGVFQTEDKIELIGGELMVAEPQSAEHYTAIRRTARALEAAFDPGWDVRIEGPIALDEESEPEPDVAVVAGSLDDYRSEHPSRPVLTVEIAKSSLALDRAIKASLYARAGLIEYWILDVEARRLEVCREPAPDPGARYGASYRSRVTMGGSANVSPLAAPGATVPVADLLP